MSDCLFCKIRDGQIPCDVVFDDETVLAFRDVAPQAPVHVLIIPKMHVANAIELAGREPATLARLFTVAGELAAEFGIADSGYRTVFNTGNNGGQTVDHAHLHLLGGRQMVWPPG